MSRGVLQVDLLPSTEADRALIARTLSDDSYQSAYRASASMNAMRAGTQAVSAHDGVRQVRSDVTVLPLRLAGIDCEWLLPVGAGPTTPHPALGRGPGRPTQVGAGGVLVYLHGGGFIRGSLNLGRANASEIAATSGLPVLAVGYRQAPEHPYPAAPDDVLTAWLALRAQGWAATQMAVIGESAGGTLALNLLPRLQAMGEPPPVSIAALSPMADLCLEGASWTYNEALDVADRATGRKMVGLYLGGINPAQAEISPVHAQYKGCCPLLVMVGSCETMLSDAERLARQAAETGAPSVRLVVATGMVHGFTRFTAAVSDRALSTAGNWSRTQIGRGDAREKS